MGGRGRIKERRERGGRGESQGRIVQSLVIAISMLATVHHYYHYKPSLLIYCRTKAQKPSYPNFLSTHPSLRSGYYTCSPRLIIT